MTVLTCASPSPPGRGSGARPASWATARAKFNRKVTDFVLLDEQLAVVVIIELDDHSHIGKKQEDAERDAMLNEAGYIVLRFTEIPSIRQLHKHIGITPAMRA